MLLVRHRPILQKLIKITLLPRDFSTKQAPLTFQKVQSIPLREGTERKEI